MKQDTFDTRKLLSLTSLRVLIACALFLTAAAPALALEPMNWFRVDIPPVYILEKGQPARGYGEASMQFIMKQLPQYDHAVATMNLARGLDFLKRGEHIGFSTLLRNSEREEFIVFSIPSQLVFPLHLVVKKDAVADYAPYMNEDQEIDLNMLLTEGDKLLGIASGRSYSRIIDNILLKHKNGSNIFERSSMDVAGGLIKMLLRGRVDCILEYPVTAGHTLKQEGISSADLAHIPIQGLPAYFANHFAFPKNEWGMRVVEEVNNILRTYRTSDKYIEFYASLLTGDTRKRYIQTVRKVFGAQDSE